MPKAPVDEHGHPAPCEDEHNDFKFPLPLTTQVIVVIEPGTSPSTPAPAGVAPLR